jgi:aquaporin Z
MNPARSLAPALVSGHLEHIWVYLIAPILGALAAVGVCGIVHGPKCCETTKNVEAEECLGSVG